MQRILGVPEAAQPNGNSCGPTSLQMIALFYGLPVEYGSLVKLFEFREGNYGIHREEVVEAAKKLGFSARSEENLGIPDLIGLIDAGTPVIVRHKMRGFLDDANVRHLTVLKGYGDDRLFFNDPWYFTPDRMPEASFDEFRRLWLIDNGPPESRTTNYAIIIQPMRKG